MSLEEPSRPAAILLLAVLQGVAEFLPISSSGHLVVARLAMGVDEAGLALDVALHLGTLVAVLIVYRADVLRMLTDAVRGRYALIGWLALATLPLVVIGLPLKDILERAFESATVAGTGLLATALLLVAGEAARSRRADSEPEVVVREAIAFAPTLRVALVMGLAQVLALCPGISRAGVTITAGLVAGVPPAQAARLSFLMSIPAIAGAAIVSLPGAAEQGFGGLEPALVWGAVGLAALVGWASLRVLLLTLSRGAFRWFAAYCALLGATVLVFL